MLAIKLLLVFGLGLQGQVQASQPNLPPTADALIKANNWAGLADWFETVPPSTRGSFYTWWLQSLNKCQRWERLLAVCEAIQPQLEAQSGPRLGIYRDLRAKALGKLGRHAEAAQAFAENGRLGDTSAFEYACTESRIGEDWINLLSYAEALNQKRPQDAYSLTWKGEALVQLYRLTEAEPVLRAAVAKDPKIAYAWNNLGHCLNERKAWAEAYETFNKALALEPKMIASLVNRGRALFELKRYQESGNDFRAALALQPDNAVLLEYLHQAERYAALPVPKTEKKP